MKINYSIFALLVGGLMAGNALAAEKPIHPEANRIFRETCNKLAAAKSLSFKAEVWEDDVVAGHKVSTAKTVDARLTRPNHSRIDVDSPTRSRSIWYDGKTLTVLDKENNVYGSLPAPETIEKTLDVIHDKYGITFPLEDFLVSDPYASAMQGVTGGAYFGRVKVLGTPCQHIAFGTDKVDFQLWIAESDSMPRKVTITYKTESEQPQSTIIFNKWDLNANIPDDAFVFAAPKGAVKADVLPKKDTENTAQ